MRIFRKKKYFSTYQVACMAGRYQDECEKRNINWDEINEKLARIVYDNQKDGNADMEICQKALSNAIENFNG